MFNRTGSDNFPTHLKILVSGAPKSGKTTLLGTVPNIVVADTEPHANNLQSVAHLNLPYVTIGGTDDLRSLHMVLHDETLRKQAAESLGMDKIEAVGIDTLDTLQSVMKKERMRETRKAEFLRDDWGWLKEEMTAILGAFLSLPMHVILVVHTKTKEIGRGDDSRTMVLPGLEGSIDQAIAGMVGYSLLSFRRQEFRPDGTPFTKYWLRAEGDENYDFLGNRSAGRLPDVIEPDFKAIYDAATAGRPKSQPAKPAEVDIHKTQAEPQPEPKPEPEPQPEPQEPKPQNEPPADPAVPAERAEQKPAQDSGQRPADDEPVNGAALVHVKKVYDAIDQPFPEDIIKGLTLGEARMIVKLWRAAQEDGAEGKADPVEEMTEYLKSQEWVVPNQGPVKAKHDGTVEQVLLFVGTDPDLVQKAFDREQRRARPRTSLISALLDRGAQDLSKQADPEPDTVSTPVENQPDAPAQPAVTPEPPTADQAPTEDEAVGTVKEALGGKVIGEEAREDQPCQECGKPVDDLDIAKLSRTRFDRWLCVSDYITETKKPRVAV